MSVPCNALNSIQIIVGCDLHKQIPPPPPAGPLPAPHVVLYVTGLAMPATAKQSTTVKAGWGYALGRQHDLGMGIYHFAANALLPLVWAGAGNKAEFGVASVNVGGISGSSARMAVAVVPWIGINFQLDCCEPAPLPMSRCIASFNTVVAGFTLRDFVAGFVSGVIDSLYVWVVGKIAGAIVGGAGALIEGILAEVTGGISVMLQIGILGAAFPTVATYIGSVAELLVGWTIGSPLGYSFDSIHGHKLPWTSWGGELNDSINEWISPTPKPPKAAPPSSTPPSSSTPPPSSPSP
jgi:hypothetical protein